MRLGETLRELWHHEPPPPPPRPDLVRRVSSWVQTLEPAWAHRPATPPEVQVDLFDRVAAGARAALPTVLHPAHGTATPPRKLSYTSLPRSVDWRGSALHRVREGFSPSGNAGTRRVQVALHDAVERAEAGALRLAVRAAWWWLRRALRRRL